MSIVIKDLDLPKDGELHCITIKPDGSALLGLGPKRFAEYKVAEVESREAFPARKGGVKKSEMIEIFFEKGAAL